MYRYHNSNELMTKTKPTVAKIHRLQIPPTFHPVDHMRIDDLHSAYKITSVRKCNGLFHGHTKIC